MFQRFMLTEPRRLHNREAFILAENLSSTGERRCLDDVGCAVREGTIHDASSTARREFLKFLLASPYVAAIGGAAAFLERHALAQPADVIASPAEALSVLDFEEAAHR